MLKDDTGTEKKKVKGTGDKESIAPILAKSLGKVSCTSDALANLQAALLTDRDLFHFTG